MELEDYRRHVLQEIIKVQGISTLYVTDVDISAALKMTVDEVRVHLTILAEEGKVDLANSAGSLSANLSPKQYLRFQEELTTASENRARPLIDHYNPFIYPNTRYLQISMTLTGKIVWKELSLDRNEVCRGLAISFEAFGNLNQRQANKVIESVIRENKINWLQRIGEKWFLDLDILAKAKPTFVSGLDWAKGIAIVEPEIGPMEMSILMKNGPKESGHTIIVFSVFREGHVMETQKKIFLSHKSADKPIVRRFFNTLEATGLNPWLDEKAMRAGDNLERELLQGFKDSCAAVFFITPNFKDDGFLATEVNYAIAEKREKKDRFAIITIVFKHEQAKGTVPDLLRQYVWKEVDTELDALHEILLALPLQFISPRLKG